jgi:hypothetical protein
MSGYDDYIFNIIKQRASPTELILNSGHKVEKLEYVYFREPNADASGPGDWRMVKCSDYHGEHFVYIDPMYEAPGIEGKGHVFAMCSCGSMAVIVGPDDAKLEDSDCPEQLLVCFVYHNTLVEDGWGKHADQVGRRRWT